MTVSQWADTYRMLSPESCPTPGKYRGAAVPFAADILDGFSDPLVQSVVVMCSAQVVKTTCVENITGYFMHQDPCPVMVVQPTDKKVSEFSKERLKPMVRDTDVLRPLVKDNKTKDSDNTIESKSFPGGHLAIVSAMSDSQVQGRPRRVVLLDEVDRYPSYSPVGHAIRRANRFWNRKIGMFSTPSRMKNSIIYPAYLEGTMELWHLPCPTCGTLQPLVFDQLDQATSEYACRACGVLDNETHWKAGEGRWIAQRAMGRNRRRSFHLNALASPGISWDEIIMEHRAAKAEEKAGDPARIENFTTQIMGWPYEESGDAIEPDSFTTRGQRHWYNCDVPAGVRLLTAQADTQANRVEIEVRGWGAGWETWGIQYLVLYGTMDDRELHAQIDALLHRHWVTADGRVLQIARYVQDAKGNQTDAVYNFCRPRAPLCWAVQGSNNFADPIINRQRNVLRKGVDCVYFPVGVHIAKETLFHRLQVTEVGPGFCHWPLDPFLSDGITPRGYTDAVFAMLTNEKRVQRATAGVQHNAWVPKRHDLPVEAWDLMVYGLAAVYIFSPMGIDAICAPDNAAAPPPPPPRRQHSRGHGWAD